MKYNEHIGSKKLPVNYRNTIMKSTPLPLLNEQLRQLNLWLITCTKTNSPQFAKVQARIDALKCEIVRRQLL